MDLLNIWARGISKSKQFLRTFTFSRSGPLTLSGFSFVNFVLSSVGKISTLYSVYLTSVSKVG